MNHVFRRCLTAFSSQSGLIDHINSCQKQKPTNIAFVRKDHLKFEDDHTKTSLPIRVCADFECINQPQNDINEPNVLFKHIPNAVGYYMVSPFENKYYT